MEGEKKKDGNNSNEDKRRPWSDPPDDLLECIVGRLPFVDRISFRAVCKSWMNYTMYRSPPPLNRMPWLMVLDKTDKYMCKLVDPTSKKRYTLDMKSLKKKIKNLNTMEVHESKYGWLLISSQHNTELFLYTPFANDDNNLIELPTVNYSKSFEYATFSSNPLSEDCLFLTLSPIANKNIICIRTCRRRDHSWTTRTFKCDFSLVSDDEYNNRCWLYSEGILYYAVNDRKVKVGTLDIVQGEWVILPSPPDMHRLKDYCHMVKLDGELILINGNASTCTNVSTYTTYGCYYYGRFLRLGLSGMTWECQEFEGWKVDSDITCFVGSGYNSVIRLCEDEQKQQLEVCYCLSLSNTKVSNVMSYLNWHGLGLYGPIAEKCCRKLWIDPVVLTFVRSSGKIVGFNSESEKAE